ncbi:MAG: hypothetical protein A2079_00435 [Geobacteraceae bacterium GWC2_48_7]|nr:MAG: hypothetical protein A2079_00435 [Geobacteraceae bacterium GWC2_48_7]
MSRKSKMPLNTEFAGIDAALKRAAKAAHLLARKTKTPCYIWKDGRIVDITAKQNTPAKGKYTSQS